MCIESNPPQEVDWKQIETGNAYSSWSTQSYTYHEIFGLLVGLACCGLWHIYISILLCSCSNVGEEKGFFSDGCEEWYGAVK